MLERFDRSLFVTQAYRVRLERSQLKRDLSAMRDEYGDKACFSKHDKHSVDAAFSKDEGYLLGEHIAQHFSDYASFIYCEELVQGRILVVIILDNQVYSDAVIDVTQLAVELLPWFQGDKPFELFYYGDNIEGTVRHIDAEFVKTANFCAVKESVFNNLVINESLKTRNVKSAMNYAKLTSHSFAWILLVLFGLLVIVIGYWYWSARPKPVKVKKVNHYLAYQHQLERPSPAKILEQAMSKINQTFLLSGWQVTSAKIYRFGQTELSVKPQAIVSLSELRAWAAKHLAAATDVNNTVQLHFLSQIHRRATPHYMMPLSATAFRLADQIKYSLPNVAVTVGEIIRHPYYQEREINLQIENLSPDLLSQFAKNLVGYPLVFKKSQLTINNGLLTGTIKLRLLGRL